MSNNTVLGRRRARWGFTLVELLVVIGIIAIMVGILLPVLSQVKRKAQATACASNERQIFMAMLMFSQDNKGHLARPYLVNDVSSNVRLASVCAYLQKMTGASGHADLADDKGALWKYIKGKEARGRVLMCPGDEGEALSGWPISPGFPRNFSYSLNYLILRDGSSGPSVGLKLDKVRTPSMRIMIYEELAPNDTWCIMGQDPADIPSGRHGKTMRDAYRNNPNSPEYYSVGRGNHCFFDGHVESLAPGQLLPPKGKAAYHFPLIQGDRTSW